MFSPPPLPPHDDMSLLPPPRHLCIPAYQCSVLREGFRKKKKKCGPGVHFGGGGLEKYLPVHNSIVIFGKLSLGGN